MTVFEDTICHGTWHHCLDCNISGDIFDIASGVWKVDALAAVRRIVKEHVPDRGVDDHSERTYVRCRHNWRKRIDEYWGSCRKFLTTGKSLDIHNLRERFQLRWIGRLDRWESTAGQLLGATKRVWAERAFSEWERNRWKGFPDSTRLVLPGGNWGDLLVLPFHDLPGRISGFYFSGKGGRRDGRMFRTTFSYARYTQPGKTQNKTLDDSRQEAGLFGLMMALASGHDFGPYVLAFEDPLFAARLHIRYLASSKRPLPIVAFHDSFRGVTQPWSWRALGKTPVFWCVRPNAQILRQAMQNDGLLSFCPLADTMTGTLDAYVRKNPPENIVRMALRRAKPWPEAMRNFVAKMSALEATSLITTVESYGDAPELLRKVPELLPYASVRAKTRTACVGSFRILEKNDRWYKVLRDGRLTQLTNFTFKIHRTVVAPAGPCANSVQYEGTIRCQGHEIPFQAPVKSVEESFLLTFTGIVARAVPGAVVNVSNCWGGSRLIQTANAFCPPDA